MKKEQMETDAIKSQQISYYVILYFIILFSNFAAEILAGCNFE
jgi:hypothetical protein